MTEYHRFFSKGSWNRLKGSFDNIWHDREFRRTVLGVIIIAIITISGAAIYDNYAGGPEARRASINADGVLHEFSNIQARNECVVTYTNADNTAQANLLLAFGSIIETASLGGRVTEEQIQIAHEAREERRRYVILRSEVNERCDPGKTGGPDPLVDSAQPHILSLDVGNG